MHRFAHIADVHLGANRDPVLQRIELETFNKAMERCVQEEVDFILFSGDLFHVGIPDLGIVNEASKKMREVRDAGIPIYAIYGSHDYTPTGTSIIDILDTVGVLTKVVRMHAVDDKFRLDFCVDEKTGAKIAGISARKRGLESKFYERLDKESLEIEEGFKIFMFHCGLSEFKPENLSEMETIPISYFPREFDYYAGGHIHERGEYKLPGYDRVIFPGPLFMGYGSKDIEDVAKGEKRGFFLVSFDDQVRDVKFVELRAFDGVYFEYDATGKNSIQAGKDIKKGMGELDVTGKLVAIRILGTLSGGKTSDVDFAGLRADLLQRGALAVNTNRFGFRPHEYEAVKVTGDDIPEIESKLMKENIGAVRVSQDALKGEGGVETAGEFLKALRYGPKSNQSKKDYDASMVSGGVEVLGLDEILKEEIE